VSRHCRRPLSRALERNSHCKKRGGSIDIHYRANQTPSITLGWVKDIDFEHHDIRMPQSLGPYQPEKTVKRGLPAQQKTGARHWL
jgi:hypothetical protein